MCCTQLAGNAGPKKLPSGHHRTTLSGCIFAKKGNRQSEKILLTSNMVNFGLLMAQICLGVRGTPADFNGFRILTALLHGILVVGVSHALRG